MLEVEKKPSQLFSKRLTHIKFSQLIIEDLNKLDSILKRSTKEKYLLNSYIINLVSAWQIFIEEMLEYGVRELIKKSHNESANTIIKSNLEDNVKKFNTPNTQNIDKIFNDVLGTGKITSKIKDAENRKRIINEVLSTRHKIAHRGQADKQLTISGNFENMELLFGVAEELQMIVIDAVSK